VLEFRVLGPLEVVGDHGPVALGGPRQRATLAILLLHANRVVSIERLADDLYAGEPPVTAVTQVQRQISELRKILGAEAIETRPPGYVLRVSPGQLDLDVFEQRTERAREALGEGDARGASELLREALASWRGAPLADLAHEPFSVAIERLDEMRLAAVEQQIEAWLALARHAELVGELEQLVSEHPLRERFHGQLMLALYRSGRQAEALDVYRSTRRTFVEEFGLEPAHRLQALERAILTQDPSLDLEGPLPASAGPTAEPDRAILVLPSADESLDRLLLVAKPLAGRPGRELIVARLVAHESEFEQSVSAMSAMRAASDTRVRTATFTSSEPARDAIRLATTHDVDLVLLDAPHDLAGERVPVDLGVIFEHAPADVALLAGAVDFADGAGLFVPFGGGEHDWAALELAAWLASAVDAPVRLIGTGADSLGGRRDATRLLADASLAVQRVVGVETIPLLAEATPEALVAATETATVIVGGISPRWRREGVGAVRRTLLRDARAPVLLLHSGPRPGGLAPQESRTRFSWSIETG